MAASLWPAHHCDFGGIFDDSKESMWDHVLPTTGNDMQRTKRSVSAIITYQ